MLNGNFEAMIALFALLFSAMIVRYAQFHVPKNASMEIHNSLLIYLSLHR